MALTHPGWAVLVVLLVAVTGPVAATHVAPALDAPTASADATDPSSGTLIDDTINDTTTTTITDDTTATPTTSTTVTDTDTTTTTVDTTTTTVDTTTTTVDTTVTETTSDTTTTVTTVTTDTDESNSTETVSTTTSTIENTTEETAEETTETVNATGETAENTTEEVAETATETVDDTTNTTESTTTLGGSTETVDTATDSLDDGATDAVDSTADGVESTDLTAEDATLTDTSLTDSTLTDSNLTDELDESTDTIEETVESTDDVESVLSDDEEVSLELASDSDSALGTVNAAGSTDFDSDGSEGDAAGGEGSDGSDGDGSDDVDAETSVSVESANRVTDPVERAIGAVWQTVGGFAPEDAPVGPVGATGVGALAVLAVASRQWFVQSAGTGMPTLLSSGVTGGMGDWVEKFKRLAVPLRYSRYDDSDPLEHDTRRVLNDAIEATPGINLTDLAEQTGVPLSTARHHVRVLADENLVTTAKRRGKRRYYPVGADGVELADALSEPPKAAVLHALAVHGEAHVGLLADELDRDPSTISHHLQALAADGLVERERNGRTVVNRLAGTVESTLVGDDQPRADHEALPADD